MRVVMVGAGYVGLVSGACFAEFGADVTCVDVDEERIDRLRAGKSPIYEPGLEDLVGRNAASGRLRFATGPGSEVGAADLVFIAVGTPARRGDGHADLGHVYEAATMLAPHLRGYTVIVTKSTVPVGTAREVRRLVAQASPEADFDVASNPEFLREGAAIEDFMRPDRIVLGVQSARAEALLRELYRPLNLIETPILATGIESAELTKYACNAFLATKVSFINEIAALCEATGADVHAVARGMGLDRRIGRRFLHPGPGFGGSCFPKDIAALARIAQERGVPARIVEATIAVNSAQRGRMRDKILGALDGDMAGKRIGVLGLTFKPETDDMREAPSLHVLPLLIDEGAKIRAHDPQGMDEAASRLPDSVRFCGDPYEVAETADAMVLMTEWNAYRGLDLERIRDSMCGRVFVDLRNVYEPDAMRALGFRYCGVGR